MNAIVGEIVEAEAIEPGSLPLANARHERFCLEYMKDLNATRAATAAGFSAKTAQEQGSHLLCNVMVADRVSWLKNQQLGKRLHERRRSPGRDR